METSQLKTATEENQVFRSFETTATNVPENPDSFSALHRLPPGPWRSLGQLLDYTNWPDRERFMELDRAIEGSRFTAASEWRGVHRSAA